MNVQDIISKALIEYDSSKPVIRYLKKHANLITMVSKNDTERTKFIFVDKNDANKVILETEVEILSVFYDKYNVWSWSWSLSGLKNAECYLAKEILTYVLQLGPDVSYIKSLLVTSRGVIKDSNQIDINLAIAANFIKQPYIWPFVDESNNYSLIYYFILLNKSKLDKIKLDIDNHILDINNHIDDDIKNDDKK